MSKIVVSNISKSFGKTRAVKDISFDVRAGEIFGLLGPNGSGKTTTIRIILDIYQPDSGKVAILGGPMTADKKNHIGYLPEERGLYQDMALERVLTYMASLKGMADADIKTKLPAYLEKFDLAAHAKKKCKELSKGMQQKGQVIATLIHDPELIIIDEPFAALDPINTQLVKDVLEEERDKGKAIVMCTHQMSQVESLCDRLVLVDQGRVLLTGSLEEIADRYKTNEVLIKPVGALPASLPGVREINRVNGSYKLSPEEGVTPIQLLETLVSNGVAMESYKVLVPSLDEIFIHVVAEGKKQNE